MWSEKYQGRRRRQHRTEHKGYTPNPRTEIKIPDPVLNRTRVAVLEGRDSTDHVTAMGNFIISGFISNMHRVSKIDVGLYAL